MYLVVDAHAFLLPETLPQKMNHFGIKYDCSRMLLQLISSQDNHCQGQGVVVRACSQMRKVVISPIRQPSGFPLIAPGYRWDRRSFR